MKYFNKYLLDSLDTNKVTIAITDEEYQKINKNILKYKKIYQHKINAIYKNDHRNIYTMYKHTKIVRKIIYKIIKLFPFTKEYGACTFLTGSFARCSCKKNSDLDLHIVYLNKYDDESLKYEEIIHYMLSQIFELGRNKIHPMLITRMHPEISDYLEKRLDNKDLVITIKSNIGEYNYIINGNMKRRIYLEYCHQNTVENIFAYIKKEVDGTNNEWAHVLYPITMKREFNKHYQALLKYEKSTLNYSKILKRIDAIKKEIMEINNTIDKIDNINISEFKTVYQLKEFSLINNYISYKRDYCLLFNKKWPVIDYYQNRHYLNKDPNFNIILDYMFALFKIVEPLQNRYSIHSNEKIQLHNYDTMRKKIDKLNKSILTTIIKEEKNGTNNYNDAPNTI